MATTHGGLRPTVSQTRGGADAAIRGIPLSFVGLDAGKHSGTDGGVPNQVKQIYSRGATQLFEGSPTWPVAEAMVPNILLGHAQSSTFLPIPSVQIKTSAIENSAVGFR